MILSINIHTIKVTYCINFPILTNTSKEKAKDRYLHYTYKVYLSLKVEALSLNISRVACINQPKYLTEKEK